MGVVKNCKAMFANRRKLFHVYSYVTSGLPVCRPAHPAPTPVPRSEDSHCWLFGVQLRAATGI